jgi:hypothetical protein
MKVLSIYTFNNLPAKDRKSEGGRYFARINGVMIEVKLEPTKMSVLHPQSRFFQK